MKSDLEKKINILSNFFKVSVEDIKKYYNINEYTYSLVNNIICIYYYYGYGQRIKTNNINIYFMYKPINVITYFKNFKLFNLLKCDLDICFYKKYYKNINNAATKYYYCKYNYCKYNYLNRYYLNIYIYLYNITKYKYKDKYYYKYNKINTKIINLNQFYYLINKIYFIFYFYYIYI